MVICRIIHIRQNQNKMLPYRSLTDRLRTQHEALEVIIENIPAEKLVKNQQPGKWSIKDNIAHLAKYQPVFIDRIHRINKGDTPSFESYHAETDTEFPAWQTWDLQTLLERLYEDRKLIISLVDSLSCTQLSCSGTHARFGVLTMMEWTEFFLLHEAHHLFTIFKLAHETDLS